MIVGRCWSQSREAGKGVFAPVTVYEMDPVKDASQSREAGKGVFAEGAVR